MTAAAGIDSPPMLTPAQWEHFDACGYVVVRGAVRGPEIEALRREAEAVMLGVADCAYDALRMERDGAETGSGRFSPGFKGPSLDYLRIEGLESVPAFLRYVRGRYAREACRRIYGATTDISAFRVMLVNKPPGRGARIGWHQDRWNYLDGEPILTIWTALDAASAQNGALRIVPGSHRRGLLCPEDRSGFLSAAMVREHCRDDEVVVLDMDVGDVAYLHNLLLHRSEPNRTSVPRRALSVCYTDASTRNVDTGVGFPVVFHGVLSEPSRQDSADVPAQETNSDG